VALGQRGAQHRHLLERSLPAYAARGGGVEAARSRIAEQWAGDLDDVGGEVRGRSGVTRSVDETLAMKKTQGQLLVVPGCPHRHRQWRAIDADLQRRLDGHIVTDAVVGKGSEHGSGEPYASRAAWA
jgi:hypothetical protein